MLKELLQYQEDWHRYEFAKSCGQIHSHAIYFSKSHYDKIRAIVDQDQEDENVDIPKVLQQWLQSNDCNSNDIFSQIFVSMHPAGGIETVE